MPPADRVVVFVCLAALIPSRQSTSFSRSDFDSRICLSI